MCFYFKHIFYINLCSRIALLQRSFITKSNFADQYFEWVSNASETDYLLDKKTFYIKTNTIFNLHYNYKIAYF